jgi:hypothetical protein
MVLQPLKRCSSFKKKGSFALPLLLTSFLNAAIEFNGILDLKSNTLPVNIFEKKWDTLPSNKKDNYAFGGLYFDAIYRAKHFDIGVFREENINLTINDGFIKTWFYANNSFDTLLNSSDIGQNLEKVFINGNLNYYKTNGLFIRKKYHLNQRSSLVLKAKLLSGIDMHFLNTQGKNDDNFELSFDYFYTNKNYISKNTNHSNGYKALGYGFDLKYSYKYKNLNFDAAVLNLASYLYWKNITLMHYDFNSQTIYKGDDGYDHLRPFGQGYYKHNINYKQKLPTYYQANINYLGVGVNTSGYNSNLFNQLYLQNHFKKLHYKIGYTIENKGITLNAKYKNISLGISRPFSSSKSMLFLGYKFSY